MRKNRARVRIDGHDGRAAEQSTVVHALTQALADGRDDTDGRGLIVDDTDGHLVGDDAGDGLDGGVAGNGDHVEADRADTGHGLKLLERESACLDGGDHARIFGDGDEGTRKTANAGAGHNAALLDGVVQHCEGTCGAGATAGAHANDLENAGNGVAYGGGGGKGKVHDALFHAQAAGSFAAHELSGARDLKGGLLDLLGNFHHRGGVGKLLQGGGHDAGAGDADVDNGICLAATVHGTCHKGRVLDHVGKADEL